MTRILVVDDEPLLCDMFRVWLRDDLGADVQCSLTGRLAAQLMVGNRFDLAVIDAVLPDLSGVTLAGLAANQNIPTLLTSGHPQVIEKLGRLGFPTLQKPFMVGSLIAEATAIMRRAAQNIVAVKTSAAEMHTRGQALKVVIEKSRRLVDAIAVEPAV